MNPTEKRPTFCQSLHLYLPMSGQKTMVSMTGGAIRAKVEELAAPTNDMNRSNLGIIAANITAMKRSASIIITLIALEPYRWVWTRKASGGIHTPYPLGQFQAAFSYFIIQWF